MSEKVDREWRRVCNGINSPPDPDAAAKSGKWAALIYWQDMPRVAVAEIIISSSSEGIKLTITR